MLRRQLVAVLVAVLFLVSLAECKKHKKYRSDKISKPRMYKLSKNRTKVALPLRDGAVLKKLGAALRKAKIWSGSRGGKGRGVPGEGVRPPPLELDWESGWVTGDQSPPFRTIDLPDGTMVWRAERRKRDLAYKRGKRFFTNADDKFTLPEMVKDMEQGLENNETMVNVTQLHQDAILRKFEKVRNARNNELAKENGYGKKLSNQTEIKSEEEIMLYNKNILLPVLQEIVNNILTNEKSIKSVSLCMELPTQSVLKEVKFANLTQLLKSDQNDIGNINEESGNLVRTRDEPNSLNNSENLPQNVHQEDNRYLLNRIKSIMSKENKYYDQLSSNVESLYKEFLRVNGFINN